MDYSAILTAIGSVGFPIVCCIYLVKVVDDLRKTLEKHTQVLTQICTKLDMVERTNGNDSKNIPD